MSESSQRFSPKLISIILVTSFLISYIAEIITTRHQLAADARKLENVISEAVNYVSALGIYLGRKISDNNKYEDWNYINNLFKETAALQGASNNVSSWAMFSWGDKKYNLMVNTMTGISKNPLENLMDRNYSWRARYEPWSLQFSQPIYGFVSKTWILPGAIGVSNIRDEFKGSVIVGINIKNLLSRAENSINSGNAFLLANRDTLNQDENKIILLSSNSPKSHENYIKFSAVSDKYKDWMDHSGSMMKSITAGRFKYNYYQIIEGYPLIILVGFDRLEFWGNILLLTAQMTVMTMLFLFLCQEKRDKKQTA